MKSSTTVMFVPDFYIISPGIFMRSFSYAYNLIEKSMVPEKSMVQIDQMGFRSFTNASTALTHRHDFLIERTKHVCPTCGVGINCLFIKRIMFKLGFQYYEGYKKAVINLAVNNYLLFICNYNKAHISILMR